MTVRWFFSLARTAVLGVAGLLAFTSTLSAQTPTLTWNANGESNLAGYVVEYGTQSASPSSSVDVGRVTSRQFTGLASGQTYYFRVKAYNTTGQTSGPSTQVSYTVPGTSSPQPTITAVSPTAGPTSGGTVITVTGSNFATGTVVRVGGVNATGNTFVSSTQLRATTPAGTSGLKSVQVVKPNGQSATRSNAFTYTSSSSSGGGQPTLTSVTPYSGPTSGATLIVLTGSNFVTGARVRVGGVNATSSYIVNGIIYATTPPGSAGGKSVQVINPNGQSATLNPAYAYISNWTLRFTSVSPSSGPTSGNTLISIRGAGFASGQYLAVYVNGVRATSVQVVSSTEIRARTPASSSGAKVITINNGNGQSLRIPLAYTYYSGSSATAAPELTARSAEESDADAAMEAAEATEAAQLATAALAAGMPAAETATPGDVAETSGAEPAESGDETGLEPAAEDTDGDGLPTSWEQAFGLAPDSDAGDAGADGDPDGDGVSNALEYKNGTHPRGLVRRYLAEGAATADLHTRLAIANPASTPAVVLLSFVDARGAATRVPVTVPARSRRTIDTASIPELNGKAFATELESDQVVALDRLMWGAAGSRPQVQTAVEKASTRWQLAAESTKERELFYLVQNPGDVAAEVNVQYQLAKGSNAVTKTYAVAPHSRLTIAVDREAPALSAANVSALVTSTTPIVVERSVYAGSGQAPGLVLAAIGTDVQSAAAAPSPAKGAVEPAARWLVAEAEQGATNEPSMLLQVSNAATSSTRVTVTVLFEDGAEQSASFELPATQQIKLPISRGFPSSQGQRVSVLVESADPNASLVVERWLSLRARDDESAQSSASPGTRLP